MSNKKANTMKNVLKKNMQVSGIESYRKHISTMTQISQSTINKVATSSIHNSGLTFHLKNILKDMSMSAITKTFEVPIMSFISSIVHSPTAIIREEIEKYLPEGVTYASFNELYLSKMYEMKWFPYLGQYYSFGFDIQVLNIANSNEDKETIIKMIDQLVFDYYNDNEIEEMKNSWKHADITKAKLRILNEAVNAYYRREYALTVSTIVLLWEGIIARKVNEVDNKRTSSRTKENLKNLIEKNGYEEVINSYCKEFIFYSCSNSNEVIKDVPGRHSIAHSWYEEYPSKKMALNAIFFTDFLLNLDKVSIENS